MGASYCQNHFSRFSKGKARIAKSGFIRQLEQFFGSIYALKKKKKKLSQNIFTSFFDPTAAVSWYLASLPFDIEKIKRENLSYDYLSSF
jgi:hypothetical protein